MAPTGSSELRKFADAQFDLIRYFQSVLPPEVFAEAAAKAHAPGVHLPIAGLAVKLKRPPAKAPPDSTGKN